MTDTELAYHAGIFDIFGVMDMIEHRGRVQPKLEIRTSNRALLDQLAEAFGGSVCTYRCRGKTYFYWRRICNPAKAVVEQIRPYLRLRTEEADRILRWSGKSRGLARVRVAQGVWAGLSL